jgi:hypothetical protein
MVKRKHGDCPDDPQKGDGTYVFMRAEDRSPWMRLSFLLDKYKSLVYLGGFAMLALGFDFKTPKTAFAELRGNIIENRQHNDSAFQAMSNRIANLETIAVNLDALMRIRCVELSAKPRDLMLAGIDCSHWVPMKTTPTPSGRP